MRNVLGIIIAGLLAVACLSSCGQQKRQSQFEHTKTRSTPSNIPVIKTENKQVARNKAQQQSLSKRSTTSGMSILIAGAIQVAREGLTNRDLVKIKKALGMIQQVRAHLSAFEARMKMQQPPWTNNQIGAFLRKEKWNDLSGGVSRSLRDMKIILEQPHGNNAVAVTPTLEGKPVARIHTSVGVIEIELYPKESPITVQNFLKYIEDGFYAKTVFHRVIPGFMIQGGGMTIDDTVKPPRYALKPTRAEIKNEAINGLSNVRGSIAMARKPGPDTASSQFFINVVNNTSLNYSPRSAGYTVFGKVISGMKVVDAIAAVQTQGTVPVKPVYIISAQVK